MLDSTYNGYHIVFVFFYMTYLIEHNTLHDVANIKISFFLQLSSSPLSLCVCMCECVCVFHIFFIHSSVDGHLGWLHILAIINNTVMTIGVHISYWGAYIFSNWWFFSSNLCPGVELLDYIVLFLVFCGISLMFSTVATPL